MGSLKDLQVGDPVMISVFGRKAERAIVEKVGRKWLTARRLQFNRETGAYNSAYSGHASTVEDHERAVRRGELRRQLRSEGVEVGHGLSEDQLIAIHRIVCGDVDD